MATSAMSQKMGAPSVCAACVECVFVLFVDVCFTKQYKMPTAAGRWAENSFHWQGRTTEIINEL